MTQTVCFFSTCLVEHLYPNVGMDSLALLRLCNINAVLPEFQPCCGQPAYNSGATNEAKSVARNTIDILSASGLPVVVPSASCADMICQHYPNLFIDEPAYAAKAQALSERCYELINFIADKLPQTTEQTKADTKQMRLHVSCSAARGTRSSDSWKKALSTIGLTPEEPEYAHECCGFGGTFAVKAPEISSSMAADKCQNLSKNNCSQFTSGDCGCLMNLNGYSEKQSLNLHGKHIATLLAQHYGVAYGTAHEAEFGSKLGAQLGE